MSINPAGHADTPPPFLGEVDATPLLLQRGARPPDYQAESLAMTRLADTLAQAPHAVAQTLAAVALQLTGAGSAGLSLEQESSQGPVFQWVATAGRLGKYLHGTMPRYFSPCGAVLSRDDAILMRDPARVYDYIRELDVPIREVLLVPFHRAGVPVGTVWVVHHDDEGAFDQEALRILRTLTRFAAAAVQTVDLLENLRTVDEQKDRFLAMLAHELRNPLAPIKLSVQLLKRLDGTDMARQRRSLDVIDKQSTQLATLINDITDVVSIRSGKLSIHKEPVTLQELVARALEVSGPLLRAKEQPLDLVLPEAPLTFEGDPSRLTQVLVNLVNNASKYTPERGIIRLVGCATAYTVEIRVSDSGIGIPAHALPRIFDMFMQVPLPSRLTYTGLGVGLSLVRQIVGLHGGTVSAASEGEGLGSTFTVNLPLAGKVAAPAG